MRTSFFLLVFTFLVSACSKPAAQYPTLHGVIQEVRTEQGSLLVKHEEIPGVMMAMTMPFKVSAETLKAAKKDQAITASVVRRPDGLWLEDVKPAPAK